MPKITLNRPQARLFTLAGIISLSATSCAWAQFAEPDVEVLYTLYGEAAGDQFGFIIERVTDIDGDGADEIIVGAPFNGTNTGKAYLFSGADGTLIEDFAGTQSNGYMGADVSSAGDLNNDGVNDYLIGVPGNPFGGSPGYNGRVLAISGATHTELWHADGNASGDHMGIALNTLGDVNNDGFDDVIVGAERSNANVGNAGQASILSGEDGSVIRSFEGELLSDFAGNGVCGLGDINDDSIPDFAVGARNGGPGNRGQVYVLSGADASIIRTHTPDTSGGSFGWFFLAPAGDVDADGVTDLYVPDFSDSLGGRAYVYSGATGEELQKWTAESAGDCFGIGRSAGDVNGDGHDDLFLAAYLRNEGANNAGKGYVFDGKDGSLIRTMTNTVSGNQTGFDAIGLGDINGDGAPDFAISAPFDDTGANNAGAVYVIAGHPMPCRIDFNGDGSLDFIDVSTFLKAFFKLDPIADLNADGDWNFFDVAEFMIEFKAGCP